LYETKTAGTRQAFEELGMLREGEGAVPEQRLQDDLGQELIAIHKNYHMHRSTTKLGLDGLKFCTPFFDDHLIKKIFGDQKICKT
jgi:hypothetical protein